MKFPPHPETGAIALFYNFSNAEQLKDWVPAGMGDPLPADASGIRPSFSIGKGRPKSALDKVRIKGTLEKEWIGQALGPWYPLIHLDRNKPCPQALLDTDAFADHRGPPWNRAETARSGMFLGGIVRYTLRFRFRARPNP